MWELTEAVAALRDTSLAGLPVEEGPAGALVVPGIDTSSTDRLLDAWRAAHAMVPASGRWPVLMTTDFADDRLEYTPFDAGTQAVLTALDKAAHTADPWPMLQEGDDGAPEFELSFYTEGKCGVDVTAAVLPSIGPDPGKQQVLRAAYAHVLADPALTAKVRESTGDVVSIDDWYEPDEVSLLLLPTASPWLAAHWIGFYGTLDHEGSLAAALRQWHDRWDARLVACWDTMLQFEVHRPPTHGDDAWTAARQLLALGPDSHIQQWELAIVVATGDAWFVHNRP